jgi:tetratricopeptide (TPR) repeat protein
MDPKELLTKAHQAYRVKDFETAESILSSYLESSPEDSDAYILLGSIRTGDKRFDDAAEAFRKAISLDGGNVEAFNNLGVVLRQSGQNDQAIRAFTQALSLDGSRADIHYNLGNLYKVIGDHGKATEHYRAAIAADPGVSMAYNNLGNLLLGQGDVGAAVDVFRDGLQVDPNHPSLHYNLGVAYQFQEMPEQAISAYEQALKSRPGWPAALNNLGVLYQKTNHLQEAMRAFSEAVKTQPDDATALNNLGTVKALLGDVDGAVADFQRSLRVTPEYERPGENLAQLLQAHPELENASRILDSLATRYRRNQIVQRARAEDALGRGDYPAAEDALEVLVDRDSKDRYALRMLGVLAFRRGDAGRAKEFFGRLEALHPPDLSYRKDVARMQLEAGKHVEALATIDDYLRREPEDLDGLVCRADILMEQDRHQEALDFLEEITDRFPESTRILSRIARVHRRMGDREEALDAADRLISLQGHRGNAADLTSLNESLRMYEEAVEAFEDDHSEVWKRNLERLAELVQTASEVPAEEAAESLTPDESPEIDEESIPILDLAPMEFEIDDALEIEAEDLEDDMMWEGEEEPDSILQQAEGLGGGYGSGAAPPAASAPPAAPEPTPGREPTATPAAPEPPELLPSEPVSPEPAASEAPRSPEPRRASPEAPPPFPDYPMPQPVAPQPALTGSISIVSGPPWPAASWPPPPQGERVSWPYEAPAEEEPGPEPELEPEEELGPELDLEPEEEPEPTETSEPTEEPELALEEEFEVPEDFGIVPDDEGLLSEEEPPGDSVPEDFTDDIAGADSPGPGTNDGDNISKAALFDYLLDLSNALPGDSQKAFAESDLPLKIATIRARLLGSAGLRGQIERSGFRAPTGMPVAVTPTRIADTFSYLGQISGFLPKSAIGSALQQRIQRISDKLSRFREKE